MRPRFAWGSLGGRLECKPADLWVGVYVRPFEREFPFTGWEAWICVVPCLPLHLWWLGPARRQEARS